MDARNNLFALDYYSNNVTRTGSWPNRNTTVSKSAQTIVDEVYKYPRIYCQSAQEINAVGNGKLVYIK